MKLNKIDEVWNSANLLFKWIFGLLSSKNVATMATWRKDFSSLLLLNKSLSSKKTPRKREGGAYKTEGDLIIFLPWKGKGHIEKGGALHSLSHPVRYHRWDWQYCALNETLTMSHSGNLKDDIRYPMKLAGATVVRCSSPLTHFPTSKDLSYWTLIE